MGYSHEQPSNAYIWMSVMGTIAIIAVIALNTCAGLFNQYGLYGAACAFYWMIGFAFIAGFYKKLTVKDVDNQFLFVRFACDEYFKPCCKCCKCSCIHSKSLQRGVKIPYANIKSFKEIQSNSCDNTTDNYNCCTKKIVYNADAYKYGSTTMIELELTEPISFWDCCFENQCKVVQVSTDDLQNLSAWLKEQGVAADDDEINDKVEEEDKEVRTEVI